jgi:hypothetical protein
MPHMANSNFEPRAELSRLAVGWRPKCESIARLAQSAAENRKATGGRGACAASSAIKQNEEKKAAPTARFSNHVANRASVTGCIMKNQLLKRALK